jgi:hypothetical protein
MLLMKAKATLIFFWLFVLAACASKDATLPTRVPTVVLEATVAADQPLPATNTPVPMVVNGDNALPAATTVSPSSPNTNNTASEEGDVETALQDIDQEVCQEAFAAQAELNALQEQGQDVSELATAVAELVDELAYCESLLTPTPSN